MKARNFGPVKGQAFTRKEYVKGFPRQRLSSSQWVTQKPHSIMKQDS
jgi:hypothetical protein